MSLPPASANANGFISLSGSASARTEVGTVILPDEAGRHAKTMALERALLISAMCRNQWPRNPVSLGKVTSQVLLQNLMEFGVHARRYLELTDQNLSLGEHYWKNADLAPANQLSRNGRDLINKIIHHREIKLVAWTNPDANEYCVFSFAEVTSDRGTYSFCPDALAMAFISLATNL
jgi:hypothetical protein